MGHSKQTGATVAILRYNLLSEHEFPFSAKYIAGRKLILAISCSF